MIFAKCLFFIFSSVFTLSALGQRVVYSQPEKDDTRRMNFEVIGKVTGNFLIYKNIRGRNYIAVYDNDMKQIAREEHEYLPDERLINVDFFPYTDFVYMLFQYQKKNVVYCKAVKLNNMGKKSSDVIEIDTAHISFTTDNKIYSTVSSEDKSHLMVFRINTRNKSRYRITTLLLSENLALKKKTSMVMPMEEQNDYLDEFGVDNDGDFVFTKFTRNNNDNIAKTLLVWKPALSDSFAITDITLDKIYLDEVHLKIDNANKRYFLTSFYYKQRRGNIDGFYFYVWDKTTRTTGMENTITFSEELRKEAKGDANIKLAFNDYFIRNIIIKKNGGFIIGSESYYTSSRGNNWNRWDYLFGSPFNSRWDYYTTSPIYNSWYWRTRYNNQAMRHHADNLTIFSFNKDGKLEWSNVIHKDQFDDESGDYISYQLINTGSQLHFVFNQEEKRAQLLNDYTLTGDGSINRNPTLKNLDRGYEFLPKFGKQVSALQMIIPCYYRNYICFAKIDYNQ